MKVLYYGNCQAGALKTILQPSFKHLNPNYVIIECWTTNIQEHEFLNHIKTSDIIFTQPIVDNYREKNYLSTNYVLTHAKPDSKIFIFPSMYFDFYYFDQIYKWLNNEMLDEPSAYHYHKIVEAFHFNQNKEHFFEKCYNNKTFKSKVELITLANKSISELKKREGHMKEYVNKHKHVVILTVTEYIETWYKKALLFYSINHPSSHVFHYLCKKILNNLNISYEKINLEIDPLYNG